MTEYRRYYKLQRYNKDGTPYEPPMYKKGHSIDQHWWPSLESCEANHQIEWVILNNKFICDKTENDTYIKYQKLQAFIDGEPYQPKKFKKGDRVGDEEYSSLIECQTSSSSKSGCFSWVNKTDYKIKYWINDKEYETTDSPVCIGIPYNSLLFYNPRISMTHSNSNMTSINLTEIDTSELVDMGNMFEGCAKLTELDLSSFDTSAVTNMRWMFSSCSGLTSLNVSNFDTSACTDMESMFWKCSGLTSLNVSNFDTSACTNMSEMFRNCSGLTELNVSNFDTSACKNLSGMFKDCSGLSELDLSSFDTSVCTDMSDMFEYCFGLTSLNISNFDTSAVTNMYNIYGMFRGCGKLNSITCKQAFKDLCISKQYEINLPDAMREGGSGTWIIVD